MTLVRGILRCAVKPEECHRVYIHGISDLYFNVPIACNFPRVYTFRFIFRGRKKKILFLLLPPQSHYMFKDKFLHVFAK